VPLAVFLSITACFFSGVPGQELTAQLAALALLMAGATWAVLAGRTRRLPLTSIDLVLIGFVAVSMLAALLSGLESAASYTLLFGATCVAVALVVRSASLEHIIQAVLAAFACGIFISATIDTQGLLSAMQGGIARLGTAARWSPMGHGNLTGLVFGEVATAMVWAAAKPNTAPGVRLLYLALAAVAAAYILAASARGSLVALVLVAALAVATDLPVKALARRGTALIYTALALSFMALLVDWPSVGDYLVSTLELNSSVRGLDSGGTGRTELWRRGIDLILSREPYAFLLGGGLRSAGPEAIGFQTESSYITLALESGVPMGFLFVTALATTAMRSFASRKIRPALHGVFYVLLFAMIQSFFNRYLLAIGNPASLSILILASSAAIALKVQRTSTVAGLVSA